MYSSIVMTGWTTESLLDWGQFIKLAVSGMVMLCIEWWSFELGAFLTGTVTVKCDSYAMTHLGGYVN